MALHLEIVTPKGSVVSEDAEVVILPGVQGEFGVLGGHIPFLSALRPGIIRYTAAGGESKRMAIGTGFAEVGAHEKVLVLTDMTSAPDDVDLQQTRQELEEAAQELKEWTGQLTAEHDALREKSEWAQARIDVKSDK